MKLDILPLSQKDSRWATKKLPGGETMASVGCLTTCLAMVLGKTPLDLLNKDIYNGNYIDWGKFCKAFPYSFKWISEGEMEKIIKERIDKGMPTIIRISNFEHFVLAIGYDDNSKELFINDPLFGETYYITAKGYKIASLRLLEPLGETFQSDALTECLKAHGELMRQLEEKGKELVEVQKKLVNSENVCKNLAKEKEELSQKIEELNEITSDSQDKLRSANKKISQLEEQLKTAEAEKANYKRWYESALEKSVDKLTNLDLLKLLVRRIVTHGQKK